MFNMLKIGVIPCFIIFFNFQSYAIDFTLPIDCNIGEDCIISSYFDTNEEVGVAEDYTCGQMAEDGVQSMRFLLRNVVQMKKGVVVLAAEDGKVVAIRNTMDDVPASMIGVSNVRGRECGNGVIIEHKRNFKTEYCHLMQNSIQLEVGDEILKGQRVGLVGLSGLTDFPHLEFKASKRGDPFDPFLGDENLHCGSLKAYPFWDKRTKKRLKYIQTLLLSSGFSNKVPHAKGARDGKFSKTKLTVDSKMLVFWIDIFGIHAGDQLTVSLIDPSGKVISNEKKSFKKKKEQHFQFVGDRFDRDRLKVGNYIGKITLIRNKNGKSSVIIDEENKLEMKDSQI